MKILIIEDEVELSKSIIAYLQRESYTCDVAYNFREGMAKIESFDYACIVLDISLPGGDGLDLLRELKKDHKEEGVIVISAKNSFNDKIAGLNLGADDYLAKPFHLPELCARIAAIIRRKQFRGQNKLVLNELVIDLQSKTVSINNKELDLTKKESELLLYLVSNKNRVVSKNAIAANLSGESAELYDNFDFIYAHMKNLKKKLAAAGCSDYIKSIYGMGYKFTT
jgi:DNA-binding response OmpR family regulator